MLGCCCALLILCVKVAIFNSNFPHLVFSLQRAAAPPPRCPKRAETGVFVWLSLCRRVRKAGLTVNYYTQPNHPYEVPLRADTDTPRIIISV